MAIALGIGEGQWVKLLCKLTPKGVPIIKYALVTPLRLLEKSEGAFLLEISIFEEIKHIQV